MIIGGAGLHGANFAYVEAVRQLAKDLNVSAITTKRAYIDLEHEGLVYTISGKGTFVKLDNIEALQTNREKEALEEFEKVAEESKKIGISKNKLLEIIEKIFSMCF